MMFFETTSLSTKNFREEFSRLKNAWYLDHAASTLYSDTQIDAISDDLKNQLYGNPHSLNLSSKLTHDSVDQIRFRILQHFGTTTDEYNVIFTSGATSALKFAVEWFDWNGTKSDEQNEHCNGESHFIYTQDNHTSVLGLREIVNQQDVKIHCLKHEDAFKKLSKNDYHNDFSFNGKNSLFVYPAQCNFSGCKYPLQWIQKVHDGVLDEIVSKDSNNVRYRSRWFCLLDAAAYLSTSELNLHVYKPDFVAVSFHKMFGYPTGLGALIVKNSSAQVLKKSYYGGGTVLVSMSSNNFHVKKPVLHERSEDGTINYLSILSLRHGFETMYRLGGTMDQISTRVFALTQYLHSRLSTLHHSNGQPAVIIYRDTDYSDITTQGNIINFNLFRANGEYIGYTEVLNVANLHDIHLRTGCFCNPGACQRHLKLSDDQLRLNYSKGHTCAENIDLIDGLPTGSVRVSFGYMSDKADVDKLVNMIVSSFVSLPLIIKVPDDWESQSTALRSKFNALQNHFQNELPSPLDTNKNIKKTKEIIPYDSYYFSKKRTVTLSEIFVYPVKSCGAFRVESSWPVTKTGLKHDREWMVVRNGVAVTQKQIAELCLIFPEIKLNEEKMFLNYKDVPVSPPVSMNENAHTSDENFYSKVCHSKICNDRAEVVDCGEPIAHWLESVLNTSGVRLVRLVRRNKFLTNDEHRINQLSLANQAQYLLVTSASIQWLADQMSPESNSFESILLRFRSNFLVTGGLEPFEEFSWHEIRMGSMNFKVDGPAQRCQIICVNQSSGEKSKEPLLILSSALKGKLKFGVYLSLDHSVDSFDLSIGQEVKAVTHPNQL